VIDDTQDTPKWQTVDTMGSQCGLPLLLHFALVPFQQVWVKQGPQNIEVEACLLPGPEYDFYASGTTTARAAGQD